MPMGPGDLRLVGSAQTTQEKTQPGPGFTHGLYVIKEERGSE